MKYIITNFEVVYYYLDASFFLLPIWKVCKQLCRRRSLRSEHNNLLSYTKHEQSRNKNLFSGLNFLIQTLKYNKYISELLQDAKNTLVSVTSKEQKNTATRASSTHPALCYSWKRLLYNHLCSKGAYFSIGKTTYSSIQSYTGAEISGQIYTALICLEAMFITSCSLGSRFDFYHLRDYFF